VWAAAILLAAAAWRGESAWGEPIVDLYAGKSSTLNSSIHILQPPLGNDYIFEDVSFDDESFQSPIWYGVRAGYFLEDHPWLGGAIEFFHFKVVAKTNEMKRLKGIRRGEAVDTVVKMKSIVQQFQITHGVNYLTADVVVRHSLSTDVERFRRGQLQLYGGLGGGAVISHPENRIDNVKNEIFFRDEYEATGVGFHAFIGARVLMFRHFGLIAEYKFSGSRIKAKVAFGDGIMDENTHHLIGGVTVPF
jgi:hypothetical protein